MKIISTSYQYGLIKVKHVTDIPYRNVGLVRADAQSLLGSPGRSAKFCIQKSHT